MTTITLTWYQRIFNKRFGYREDLVKSFWWYMNEYIKTYLININYYSNEVKEPYQKSVEKIGPRGEYTGYYHSVTIPKSKSTYTNFKIEFLPRTWIAFSFAFNTSTSIFPSYVIAFSLEKPNWQLSMKLQNNTA